MKFEVLQEKENPVLNRKEFVYRIEEEIIPSKEVVKEELSKKYGFKKELIEVLKISGKFGVKIFEIIVHVYDNREEMDKTVLKSKKRREAEAKALAEANKPKEDAPSVEEMPQSPTEENKPKEEETK